MDECVIINAVMHFDVEVCLTQHALGLPRVTVPGFHSVLHIFRDAVGGHVLYCVIHTGTIVCLSRGGCTHNISHLTQDKPQSILNTKENQSFDPFHTMIMALPDQS